MDIALIAIYAHLLEMWNISQFQNQIKQGTTTVTYCKLLYSSFTLTSN